MSQSDSSEGDYFYPVSPYTAVDPNGEIIPYSPDSPREPANFPGKKEKWQTPPATYHRSSNEFESVNPPKPRSVSARTNPNSRRVVSPVRTWIKPRNPKNKTPDTPRTPISQPEPQIAPPSRPESSSNPVQISKLEVESSTPPGSVVSSPRNVKILPQSSERISVNPQIQAQNSPAKFTDDYVVGGNQDRNDPRTTNVPANYSNDPHRNYVNALGAGMDVFNARPTPQLESPLYRSARTKTPQHKNVKDYNDFTGDCDEEFLTTIFNKIPDYTLYEPRRLEREWIKFDTLIEKLIESGIEIDPPNPEAESLERVYVRYHTAVYRMKKTMFIENEITNIRVWMTIIWLVIELIMCFILKLNFSGYFAFQMSLMKRYDQLLYVLGEKKWVESNRTGIGSPLSRIIFISCFSSFVFLLLRMVATNLSSESCTTLTNSVLNMFLGNPNAENGASGMTALTELVTNVTTGNTGGFLRGLQNILA